MSLELPPFADFPKIPRLLREITITEKIDGTNAQVTVLEDGRVLAGSRSRWITPEDDNFGFARWVKEHEDELRTGLGIGTHFGEWWGAGIQRRYGLREKRFSLFNVHRWTSAWTKDAASELPLAPTCCHVVPILYTGQFSTGDDCIMRLRAAGSVAAPGFMQPEGIVIYHAASRQLFKRTLEKDAEPKGAR